MRADGRSGVKFPRMSHEVAAGSARAPLTALTDEELMFREAIANFAAIASGGPFGGLTVNLPGSKAA